MLRLSTLLLLLVATTQVAAQKETRKISFLIYNAKRVPHVNAKVELIDNNGKVQVSHTDKSGVAWFDIGSSEKYTRSRAIVTTTTSSRIELPVYLGIRNNRLTIEVPDNMVIMSDGTETTETGMLPPTESTDFNKAYAKPNIGTVTWGPFSPECDNNPLASVPEFSSLAVEDEKTVLDAIASSCVDAAGDAVNSLVDLTEAVVSVGIKLNALSEEKFAKFSDVNEKWAKNFIDKEVEKAEKARAEAYKNVKELYEAIVSISEGPQVYAATCMLEGIKKYAIPEEVTKMRKALDGFGKAKNTLYNKMEAIRALNASGKKYLGPEDLKLFTEWKGITKDLKATSGGLNLMVGFLSKPTKILSYESQANIALSNTESQIGSLLGDCNVRAIDKEAKEGIEAAKAGLTAARKLQAQMGEQERKWRDRMTDAAGTKPWYDPSYEHTEIPRDAMEPIIGTNAQWVQYVPYHNARVKADADVKRIGETMTKLTDMCKRINSIAPTLNQLVEKYTNLYTSGINAISKCDFKTTDDIISKLKYLEKTPCGHYYPSPYGIAKSDELASRMKGMKEFGNCKTADVVKASRPKGDLYFGLVKKEIGACPPPADGQYGILSGSMAEGSIQINYEGKPGYDAKADIKATFSAPPSTLKPGDTIEVTVDVTGDVKGKDVPYLGMSAKWSVEGAAEVVSGRYAFGGYASDGKLYPNGKETFKIKIGQGSRIVLWTTPQGIAWGTDGKWYACIYTYEWKKSPVEESTSTP